MFAIILLKKSCPQYMRKFLLTLSCAATLSAEQMYLYEVSPIIGLQENGVNTGMESSYAYGLQLQYNNIDFLIKPELMYIYSPNIQLHESNGTVNSHFLMVNGVYDIEYTALLTPFLKAGVGYQSISGSDLVHPDAFALGAGAGLKLNIKDQLSIKFETMVTWNDHNEKNILAFGGLDYAFGYEDNTPAAGYNISEPLGTTNRSAVSTTPLIPVYISKEDLNLTKSQPTPQQVVLRDSSDRLTSLTLFVPYLFRGYTLDDNSKNILKGYAQELREERGDVTVIGHTDTKGRRAYNQELSMKRALVVKEFLVEYGVAAERIIIEGHGEDEPIANSSDPEAAERNKRIEIRIHYK